MMFPAELKLVACLCGELFQPNDGIGGDRCATCCERDTIPAPPPEPAEPRHDATEHPFHAHLDKCEQCRTYPFDLCAEGSVLLRDGATPSVTVQPHEPIRPPRTVWGAT